MCREAATGPVCEESAALMTSEVVTNAMVHGKGDVVLSVDTGRLVVHVEVGDDEPHHPRVTVPAADDDLPDGGRGMHIVDLLSSAWGVRDRVGGGKHVWFEVPVLP